MSYLAFALKYRPQDFDQVVGQAHVVTSLKNSILKNRVHHAYLFSGPRGVGKTSLARIFAKALNCEKGPTVTPCGKCFICSEITKGKSLDIIEIDGASNRGIDEIRTLRENVKLSASVCRYKVYIIDEVHMLTQEAFNALLKTLEEPPAHVKFIFATTHPHKLPPTILSRCQKFQFNLVVLEEIVGKLKKIAVSEKIKIKDNLLYTIARAGEGSIRDAESLFDQLAPIILEKGSIEDIFSFLGIIDEESLNKALKSLAEKDLSACLKFVEKTVKDGKDIGIFLNAFIEHLRNLLLAKVSIDSFKELSDVSPQTKDFICELAKQIETEDILRIIDLLIEAKSLSRSLNTGRIPLELALVKYCVKVKQNTQAIDKTDKIEQAKTKEKKGSPPKIENIDNIDAEIDDIFLETETAEFNNSQPDLEITKKDEGEQEKGGQDNLLSMLLKSKWKELISKIHKTRAALSSHLSFAQPVSSYGNIVKIAFASCDSFHKESVETKQNLRVIEDIISKFINKPVSLRFVIKEGLIRQELEDSLEDGPQGYAQKPEDENLTQEAKSEDTGDDFLNDLLDTFGGKFHSEQ